MEKLQLLREERKQRGAKCPDGCQGREETPQHYYAFKEFKYLHEYLIRNEKAYKGAGPFFHGVKGTVYIRMCREELLIVPFLNYHSGTFVAM